MKLIKSAPQLLCFAPIDLKDATVYLRDGYGHGDDSPTASGAHSLNDTTVTLSAGTLSTSAPVSAVMRVTGEPDKYVITGRTINATGTDEVQEVSANGASAGTWTVTIKLPDQPDATTTALAYDAATAAIQTAVDTACAGLAVAGVTYMAGDIAVTCATTANLAPVVFTYSGTSVAKRNIPQLTVDITGLTGPTGGVASTTTPGEAVGATVTVTIQPGLQVALSGGEALEFTGRELEVEIGEGNFTYDETREFVPIRNRGRLNTYRLGDEQPVEVSFAFTWEFLGSIAGAQTPTIEEVLKKKGPAVDWISSNTDDPCAPYVVDIEIQNAPDCSGVLPEVILLPYFFYTSLSHDADASEVSVSGSCNVTEAIITRPTIEV